ncbi:hypothetical protein GCM10008967_11040 [Bacillus carboniphilus]|uniref:DUF2515 domain-containing protein n=1 Tax=Bacillus carboniphilus TaxID=86663 RepID=A0ABN0W150_9BACI
MLLSKIKTFFSKVDKEKDILSNQDWTYLHEKIRGLSYNQKVTKLYSTLEREILQSIRSQVRLWNENNVTRTDAYFRYFQKHPEIHWSFLAHMVSRNGGYHMTDLKSRSYRYALEAEEQKQIFSMLETANHLIFQDAYSQLLLYEIWKERGKNFFHLMPHLSVSPFMQEVWDFFIKNKNAEVLTVALIINEQMMLEARLIPTKIFKHAKSTFPFQVQEFLATTYILFPTRKKQLHGLPVQHFEMVTQRIETGKKLYSLLWDHKRNHKQFVSFASKVQHTSSREDYWPNIYTTTPLERKKIHSPNLEQAWENMSPLIQSKKTWVCRKAQLDLLKSRPVLREHNCTLEVCTSLLGMTSVNQLLGLLTGRQRAKMVKLKDDFSSYFS